MEQSQNDLRALRIIHRNLEHDFGQRELELQLTKDALTAAKIALRAAHDANIALQHSHDASTAQVTVRMPSRTEKMHQYALKVFLKRGCCIASRAGVPSMEDGRFISEAIVTLKANYIPYTVLSSSSPRAINEAYQCRTGAKEDSTSVL